MIERNTFDVDTRVTCEGCANRAGMLCRDPKRAGLVPDKFKNGAELSHELARKPQHCPAHRSRTPRNPT